MTASVEVVSVVGQTVYSRSAGRQREFRVQTNNLLPGIYFVRIVNSENQTLTKKIILR